MQRDCVTNDRFSRHRKQQVVDGVYHVTNKHDILHMKKLRTKGLHAVLDIGAAKTVVGVSYARQIARLSKRPLTLCRTGRRFRFGEQIVDSIGLCEIEIPTPGGVLSFAVDVVNIDVPLLLGLDILDRHRLQVLTLTNEIEHIPVGSGLYWRLPCVRHSGHIHLCFQPPTPAQRILYTESQIRRLHRHLHHPSARKLFDLLRRADPENLPPDTRAMIDTIARKCQTCQRHSSAPLSFRVRFPDDVSFNREIRLDLMFVGGRRPVLHVIDRGTNFQSATFLEGEDAASVWNGLVRCWTRLYVGDPEAILTDQGSVFTSANFTASCVEHGITLRHTGTESHNSLGSGETYHSPLRNIYDKLRFEFPQVAQDVLLQCSIYAINATAGPNGLVPCLLVFGMFPRLPGVLSTGAIQNDLRFSIMQAARKEYAGYIAKQRVATGLATYVPPAADYDYEAGDSVYLWRESERVWTGPHLVVSCVDK